MPVLSKPTFALASLFTALLVAASPAPNAQPDPASLKVIESKSELNFSLLNRFTDAVISFSLSFLILQAPPTLFEPCATLSLVTPSKTQKRWLILFLF